MQTSESETKSITIIDNNRQEKKKVFVDVSNLTAYVALLQSKETDNQESLAEVTTEINELQTYMQDASQRDT